MAIAILRGDAKESVISDTWNTDRIDVPRAPGLGLMLEEVSASIRSLLIWSQSQY